ncbi:MAG: MFS transporter [Alphaproteobacteria bacterium]|nr:MAG: MFS transporter [Alphaproteobacteria bacterium]
MTVAGGQAARWSELYSSGHFGRIVLLSFGVWLHAADELMVSTITPAMMAEIGGERFVAWLIALYEVGSIVAGAVSALIVIRLGLRAAMVAAALAYLSGCLVSGFSPSIGPMLAGRLVQGFGGGAMVAIAFIAVHRLMPGRLIARVFAVISMVWGASAFTGPLIGAGFAEAGWWRGAFFLFAAQAAAFAMLVGLRLAEGPAAATEVAIAAAGRSLRLILRVGVLAAGVVAIAAAGIEVETSRSLPLAALGLALLALFLWLEAVAGADRLLPTRPWNALSPHGSVMAALMLLSAATAGLITYGPLLMSRLHGADAVTIGLILLVESIAWSLVAILISGLPRRHETMAIAGGFAAVTLGVAGLVHTMVAGPLWTVALCALLMGGGFGAAWSFVVRRALAVVAPAERERIASAIPTTQRLGYALGAAYVGIIANGVGFADSDAAGVATATAWWIFTLSLVPAGLGLAAVWCFLRWPEPDGQN